MRKDAPMRVPIIDVSTVRIRKLAHILAPGITLVYNRLIKFLVEQLLKSIIHVYTYVHTV